MKISQLWLVAVLLLVHSAEAQQPRKIYRVGFLASAIRDVTTAENALRDALRDLGYIEGQNLVIEARSAGGKLDRFPGLLGDLVRANVDVIVVTSVQGALAAKKATQSIPIVFAVAQDPVGSGLVASLAEPGGNLTGVTDVARELAGKRLELLKETVPKASRVAVLSWKPAGPDYAAEKNEIELAARASRIDLQLVERYANNRSRIIKLVAKSRLPAVYQDWVFAQAGGLMSYGTNRAQWRRRIASYLDKILKGAKPADLPSSSRPSLNW
jgi:putative ABC transport system substrate-binding protein